jgi:hypothetical protein
VYLAAGRPAYFFSLLNTHIEYGFLKPDIIGPTATLRFYIPDDRDQENQSPIESGEDEVYMLVPGVGCCAKYTQAPTY